MVNVISRLFSLATGSKIGHLLMRYLKWNKRKKANNSSPDTLPLVSLFNMARFLSLHILIYTITLIQSGFARKELNGPYWFPA